MYPRVKSMDVYLYEAGKILEMMAIIRRGELRAEIEVSSAYCNDSKIIYIMHQVEPIAERALPKSASGLRVKGKQRADLGRIAPYSVLGKGICLCQNMHDNVRRQFPHHLQTS